MITTLKQNVHATKLKYRQSLDDSKSGKAKKKPNDSNELQLNILPDSSMELILTKLFEKFKIENPTWNQSNGIYSITFSIPNGVLHEQVLTFFKYWGTDHDQIFQHN